jgi:hypothetical protein
MVLLGAVGCQITPLAGSGAATSQSRLAPVLQRMRDTYPDLASGRFISLADFETPGQELLFRSVGLDGVEGRHPQPTLSILRSRNETGGMGLKAVLSDTSDQLVCDGKRARERVLVRDWHDYALLLMSIYGPPQGVMLEFTLQSGLLTPLRWSRTVPVHPGWNLVRLDLAAAGDWINLADVRALTWRAPQITAPLDLYIDDLIIADNTQPILGEQSGPGELSVYTRGRRLYVRVNERFELALADGQIVGWRSGNDDDNLVDPDGLGPWPVPLPADWRNAPSAALAYDDPRLFAAWGASVATTQKIIEATPFRVIVAGQWRFVSGDAPPRAETAAGPDAAGHAWQYVIYPSGAVYVSVQSRAPAKGWPAARLGYAVAVDGRRDFHRIDAPASGADAGASFVLLSRAGSARADLLWTWPEATPLSHYRELASTDERRAAVIVGDLEAAPLVQTAYLLRLWPTDIDAVPEAKSLATDYRRPATLTLTAGHLMTDAPGDLDHDGFNESEGTYELGLDGDALRYDLVCGPSLRYDPVFRVHDTAGRRCWVYARGRLVTDIGRDVDDNLLFRLGRVVNPVTIEVHTTPPEGGGR